MKRPLCRFNLLGAALSLSLACTFGVQTALATPVFEYSFPASWNGTGTAIVDQSTAANDGHTNGTLALSANVPPGATAGTQSITTSAGALVTNAADLLDNSIVAAAGGFPLRRLVHVGWNGLDVLRPCRKDR